MNDKIPQLVLDYGSATGNAIGSLRSNGDLCVLVCMGTWEGCDPIAVAGLLVHEAVHIWQTYCDQMGEHRAAVEQEAYAVQAISQELMWEFVRQTKGAT